MDGKLIRREMAIILISIFVGLALSLLVAHLSKIALATEKGLQLSAHDLA